jgi:hypothetical protein
VDKAHDVQRTTVVGAVLFLTVDGKSFEIDLGRQSPRLVAATQEQRERFEVSPSGYGIHWSDLDEDLSIDGLIGVKRPAPAGELSGKV